MFQRLWVRRTDRDRVVAGLSLAAFGLGAFLFFRSNREPTFEFTMSAGSAIELRHEIAKVLVEEAKKDGITIHLVETIGSEESYEKVNSGVIDLALAQGGLGHIGHENVRQVTALQVEPLHLLVKEELYPDVSRNLDALKGKVVNLNRAGSGTHWVALDALRFAGLTPGYETGHGNYVAATLRQQELEKETDREKLPDAVFVVMTIPSKVAKYLVTKQRYRLVPLPFGEAFSLDALNPDAEMARRVNLGPGVDKMHIYDTVIPAFTYQVEPAVPPQPIHTLGTRMLFIANKSVPSRAIARLIDIIFSGRFSYTAKPPLDSQLISLPPELPLHSGTLLYLERNKPLITGDVVNFLEKATTIGAPILGGSLFLWQWFRQRYRRRRDEGFEHYIFKVTEIERRVLQLEMSATLQLRELLQLQQDLGHLKSEALARFVAGELEGEELMSGFLAHVNDARNYLARLILHGRDSLEDEAHSQGRPMRALWNEAMRATQDSHPVESEESPAPAVEDGHQNFQSPVEST
jgi:TRAP-type uncharacterized transport system substrate-binding protein